MSPPKKLTSRQIDITKENRMSMSQERKQLRIDQFSHEIQSIKSYILKSAVKGQIRSFRIENRQVETHFNKMTTFPQGSIKNSEKPFDNLSANDNQFDDCSSNGGFNIKNK